MMSFDDRVRAGALALSLAACGSAAQPPCLGASGDTCTTTESRYNFVSKHSEKTTKEWGCNSWSTASSCNHWVENNSHNAGLIESAKGLQNYLDQSRGIVSTSPNGSSPFLPSSGTPSGTSSSSEGSWGLGGHR